jgi:hypothetical protein
VVDSSVWEESYLIECFRDVFLFAPVDVPVVFFGLRVVPADHGFLDAVLEEGFEFDVGAEWVVGY